jgi:mechanosensitive ion channel-like protein
MWEQVREALNQSTARVITGMADLLPGFVAMLVALAVSAVLAWLLAAVLRRFLTGIDFDGRMESWGLASKSDASTVRSPTLLVSRTAALLVIFVGFLIGVAAFNAAFTSELAMGLFQYLPNVVAAAALFVVGSVLARFMERGVLISAVNHNLQYARLLSVGVKWLVLVLTAAMALKHLRIGGEIVNLAFGILFGGIVLTLALAIGLGSKDLVSKSLERQTTKPKEEEAEPFHHI